VYEMHEGVSRMEVEVNCCTTKLQGMEDTHKEILETLSASWALGAHREIAYPILGARGVLQDHSAG
jgi:hypothetical protein